MTKTQTAMTRATIRKILLGKRSSIAELSRALGYHPAQVSGVLRGIPTVGVEKREQILRAAQLRAQEIIQEASNAA